MEDSKLRPFEQTLAVYWPPAEWREISIIVAVSGGPDSVALLRTMATIKREAGGVGQLIVAHLNHHLRPEADDHASFVAELAQRLELPYERGDAAVAKLAAEQGDGIEASAREARYQFLQQTAQKFGARYVATAHTADDQIETVLLNIIRGTGLSGLTGIPRARLLGPSVSLIRPMLQMHRDEVVKYLDAIGQRYCVDSSNASHDFTRNRVRHELLPLLQQKYNPDIAGAISRLSHLASDAQQMIEHQAQELLDRCADTELPTPGLARRSTDRNVTLDIAPLAKTNRHLVREMFVTLWQRLAWPLQNMGFAQWDSLAEIAQRPNETRTAELARKRIFPGNISVERRGDTLHLTQPNG